MGFVFGCGVGVVVGFVVLFVLFEIGVYWLLVCLGFEFSVVVFCGFVCFVLLFGLSVLMDLDLVCCLF